MLSEKGTYNDNKKEGNYFKYHNNGEIESITPYKNDSLAGYYASFYLNGKLRSQGWYKKNNQHGEWRNYYGNGNLESINFHHKGLLHGEQQYFSGEGKKTSSTYYDFGAIVREISFDHLGGVFEELDYRKSDGEGILVSNHFNKKPKTKITLFKRGNTRTLYSNRLLRKTKNYRYLSKWAGAWGMDMAS